MSEYTTPVTTPPRRAPDRERHRVRPDGTRLIASRAVRTLWVSAVTVVALSAAVVLVAVIAPPHAVVVHTALAAVIVAVVAVAAVRTGGRIRDLRPAAHASGSSTGPLAAVVDPPAGTSPAGASSPVLAPPGAPGGAVPAAARHAELSGTLSRRLQSLLARMITAIDELERGVEDPALLKGLYNIDHLATQARRLSENSAILGGSLLQGRTSPTPVGAVLRAAVAETARYQYVQIASTVDADVQGHAVAQVIHLVAELLDNATMFTDPRSPKVVVRASLVTAGLAIEVQDRGLGIQPERLRHVNAVLDGSVDVDLDEVVSDGRIGLAVVTILASHHDVKVRLVPNIYGGTDAVVVVPADLLVLPEARPDRQVVPGHRLRGSAVSQPRTPSAVPPSPPPPEARPVDAAPEDRYVAYRAPVAPPQHTTGREAHAAPAVLPRRRRAEFFPAGPDALAGTLDIGGSAGAHDSAVTVGDTHGGGAEVVAGTPAAPPPLPQRDRSYMHPLLRENAAPAASASPFVGHDTGLLASIQNGRRRAEEESPDTAAYPYPTDAEGHRP